MKIKRDLGRCFVYTHDMSETIKKSPLDLPDPPAYREHKPGRPRGRTYPHLLQVKVPDEWPELFGKCAKKANMPKSHWIRQVLREAMIAAGVE